MAKAIWKGAVLAESDSVEVVEGNVYFPPESLKMEHFKETATTTTCGWKGTCNYYSVVVGDDVNVDAAWVYREPFDKARAIKGHVAFWRGVEVTR